MSETGGVDLPHPMTCEVEIGMVFFDDAKSQSRKPPDTERWSLLTVSVGAYHDQGYQFRNLSRFHA